jgi:hypothetical protein
LLQTVIKSAKHKKNRHFREYFMHLVPCQTHVWQFYRVNI